MDGIGIVRQDVGRMDVEVATPVIYVRKPTFRLLGQAVDKHQRCAAAVLGDTTTKCATANMQAALSSAVERNRSGWMCFASDRGKRRSLRGERIYIVKRKTPGHVTENVRYAGIFRGSAKKKRVGKKSPQI